MRAARLLIACLLSLAVSAQGFAALRVMDGDCAVLHAAVSQAQPQQAAEAAHAHHDAHDSAPATSNTHNCETDDAGAGHGGKHCVCVMGCHAASSAAFAVTRNPDRLQLLQLATSPPTAAFHSHTVFSHWRPPALI